MLRPSVPARRPVGRVFAALFAVVLGLLLGLSACSGTPVGPATSPSPQPSGPTASSSGASGAPGASSTPSVPANGVTLATLGFGHGPLQTFSLPQPLEVTATSDQASLVTLVLASPSPTTVYAYLNSTLPQAGYTITGRLAPTGADPTPTLAFVGHGWSGNFTGAAGVSAVTLRPST